MRWPWGWRRRLRRGLASGEIEHWHATPGIGLWRERPDGSLELFVWLGEGGDDE